MHWLSHFQHYIVSGIHNIVDWSDIIASQTAFNPFRRTSNLNIFQQAAAETAAIFRFCNVNRSAPINRWAFFLYFCLRKSNLTIENSSCFQCHADHAKAICTIWSKFHFKDYIIQVEYMVEIHPYRCIGRKNHNPFRFSAWIQIIVKKHFRGRAHHTRRRQASQFAFLNLYIANLDSAWCIMIMFSRKMSPR